MKPRSGTELLERAVALLRQVGVAGIAIYVLGALPWATALLYFFANMTYNARAGEHLAEYSLAMALLFLWKNCWQAVYTARLYDTLADEVRPWPRARAMRMILITCAVQPWSIVVLPVAMLITLPYAQALGFFRNLQLFAGSGGPHPEREAWRLSALDGKQNWVGLLILALAAFIAFLNVLLLLAGLPTLAKMFFGVESDLSRLGARILSPLLLVAAWLVVYLVFDPLLDAFYTVRCFHGKAIATGEDLRIGLRRAIAATVLGALLCTCFMPAQAAEAPKNNNLDRSISKVLERDEFLWRAPKQGANPAWVESLYKMWRQGIDQLSKFLEWLFNRKKQSLDGDLGRSPDRSTLEMMLYASAAVFLVVLGCILYWQRSQLKRPVQATAAGPLVVTVDLKDESLTADALPEAEWLALATTESSRGEYRLATRALYLAGLNHLMHRNLVSVKKWKSGLEYLRELDRRAKAAPQLPPVFADCLQTFERGWYGFRSVDVAAYQSMRESVEKMRGLHG